MIKLFLFLTTAFMTTSWNTFELFNGELENISEDLNNDIQNYLERYITYEIFKADLAFWNIPYINHEYYKHLIKCYCEQLKTLYIVPMKIYPEFIYELDKKKYLYKQSELLCNAVRKSFLEYISYTQDIKPKNYINVDSFWIGLRVVYTTYVSYIYRINVDPNRTILPANHLKDFWDFFIQTNFFQKIYDNIADWILRFILCIIFGS